MRCGVFRWTLVYFGVYTDRPPDGESKQMDITDHKMTNEMAKCRAKESVAPSRKSFTTHL